MFLFGYLQQVSTLKQPLGRGSRVKKQKQVPVEMEFKKKMAGKVSHRRHTNDWQAHAKKRLERRRQRQQADLGISGHGLNVPKDVVGRFIYEISR